MIDKQFLIYSEFVFRNKGKCDCGFEFISGDLMQATDEDINPETVMVWGNEIEFFCPECGKQLATITLLEVDEGFDSEMLQPFKDADVPIPFDRLDEMEKIYDASEDFNP